jgi:phosphoglycerate dehydrogenase-like enzyme
MQVLIFDSQADFYAKALARQCPQITFHAATDLESAINLASESQVLVGLAPYLKPELLAAMPDLEWIQALTTGVDNLLGLKDIALTSCGGIHGPQMSELAVLMMLSLQRRFPQMLANQRSHTWDRQPQSLLLGKTACILGVGAIAEHLGGVLAAFGMTVTGVSGRTSAPGIDRLYPRRELPDAVADADFLIVLTPYSKATHHIVNAEVLAAMKPSAFLINIARGGCVDEDAVSDALQSGKIAGAALDVFAQSPLPPQSPLWDLPNVILTPHIGGFADCYHEQALPIVAANMADYARGGITALKERLDQ